MTNNFTVNAKESYLNFNKLIKDNLVKIDILNISNINNSKADVILLKDGLIDLLIYLNQTNLKEFNLAKRKLIVDVKIYDLLPKSLKSLFYYLDFKFIDHSSTKKTNVINFFRLSPFYTSTKNIDMFFDEIKTISKYKNLLCPIFDTSRKMNYEFDHFNSTCHYFFKKAGSLKIIDIKDVSNFTYPANTIINFHENYLLRGFSLLFHSLMKGGNSLKYEKRNHAIIHQTIAITPNLNYLICSDKKDSEANFYQLKSFQNSYNENIKNNDFSSLYKLVEYYAN